MKCTIVLLTTFVLMVCVLFAGWYKPHRRKDQTLRNNGPGTLPGNNIFINFHGSIDTTFFGDPSLRTKCWHPGRETAS